MDSRAVFTDEHLKLVIRNRQLEHVVTREDLVATGMDDRLVNLLAESTEGINDHDSVVVVRWCQSAPLPIEKIEKAIESPTDREITSRAEQLQGSADTVGEIQTMFEAMHGRGPSAKELKKCLRDNAAADLIREDHQLVGLYHEAEQMARQEMARIKLAKSGASEEEIRKLDLGPGTDVFIVGKNDDGNGRYRTRTIPLNLAEAGTWTETKAGREKPITITHAFWRLERRFDEVRKGIFHRACRTGRLVDGQYTHLVYYRLPVQNRRGVIVAIPMDKLTEMLQLKYMNLGFLYNLWNRRSEP